MKSAGGRGRALPESAWLALGIVFLAALWWACRGAPLGTAVVDDYSFLDRLRFQRPLDPFDSMGASYYWRPLSRQLYFMLIGPWLLAAPWGAALLHAVLLFALYVLLYRSARRGFSPPVAAAIAASPLLGESARVLLGWPSAAQHLLAMVAVACAIHESLAGRRWTAALAALAAVLSHDAAVIVPVALPVVAYFRTRRMRDTMISGAFAIGVLVLWAAGYTIARARGVELPPATQSGFPFGEVAGILLRVLVAHLNLEEMSGERRAFFASLYGVLVVAAVVLLSRRAARARLVAREPVLLGGIAWFVLASAPLALLLPDWNAWRASLPALGLGVALTGLMGLASPWLAGAWVVLRLVTLGLTTPAPVTVSGTPPATPSHISFVRLVRLQHAVDGTREALTQRFPSLPRGADVRFWGMPQLCEVGFQGARAVRVWYGDSTITWNKFGGMEGMERTIDALVEFETKGARVAMVVEPRALELLRQGMRSFMAQDLASADSLFDLAGRTQPAGSNQFFGTVAINRSAVAYNRGDFARADSLNRLGAELGNPSPAHHMMVARLAMQAGDRTKAVAAVRSALMLNPNDVEGRRLAQMLGMSVSAGAP
ncbi:MAG TPA: hypothetical protein VEY91_02900 [Candidatus Limnocylindria bacterium]|nr:hypothetical protein [Candidatus Limnocylindria bacterium]